MLGVEGVDFKVPTDLSGLFLTADCKDNVEVPRDAVPGGLADDVIYISDNSDDERECIDSSKESQAALDPLYYLDNQTRGENFTNDGSAEIALSSTTNCGIHSGQEPGDSRCMKDGSAEIVSSTTTELGFLSSHHPGDTPASPRTVWGCRRFWKAGEFEAKSIPQITRNQKNYMRLHPKFLHSNATSHKWAFGAIAELLDNAIDEVKNGATYVKVNKIRNAENGEYALVIQDDGSGMDPMSLRQCMSFGFSNKCSQGPHPFIGQYGNGFKTGSMRLGADALIFTRNAAERTTIQSVGLLSYSFLTETGSEDIIVPIVDYEHGDSSGMCRRLFNNSEINFHASLEVILRWSPFTTEAALLEQFNDIGPHGTKIVVYNLWFNDAGLLELDFTSDDKDIMITEAPKFDKGRSVIQAANKMHIAHQLRYSLRVYASILYLHLPKEFKIILCGHTVEPHYIVDNLRYVECIRYRPIVGGSEEAEVVTTIGFLEGAPHVNVHGFSVYHKNRLILPFWPAGISTTNKAKVAKSRGVAGVLEANFIKPTHDKQDFEKSSLFQKLELRLRDMTTEYWHLNCHKVGYVEAPKHCRRRRKLKWRLDNTPTNASQSSSGCGIPQDSPDSENCNIQRVAISSGTLAPSLHIPTITPLQMIKSSNKICQSSILGKRSNSQIVDASKEPKRKLPLGGCDATGDYPENQERAAMVTDLLNYNKLLKEEVLELATADEQLKLKESELRSELKKEQELLDTLTRKLQVVALRSDGWTVPRFSFGHKLETRSVTAARDF